MELQEAISLQKAVKKFLPKKVESEKIDAIIRAGNACEVVVPVDFHITVITRESTISFIEKKARELWLSSDVETFRKIASNFDNSPVCNAPALIVLSVPQSSSTILRLLAAADCACAAQNMMLTATERGLGTCMLNTLLQALHTPEVMAKAEIPVEDRCIDVILVGYPEDMAPKAPKPFANNVHYCG